MRPEENVIDKTLALFSGDRRRRKAGAYCRLSTPVFGKLMMTGNGTFY
jgi:hypothetical protein